MEDKQKKFLDKVVGFIVMDTKIDYDNNTIKFPFFPPPIVSSPFSNPFFSLSSPPFLFSTYCKEMYGLTDKEIEYVWL